MSYVLENIQRRVDVVHGILDQIIEMSAAGLSAEQISVALGLDFETYRWVLYG